jgi:hypothetical protein
VRSSVDLRSDGSHGKLVRDLFPVAGRAMEGPGLSHPELRGKAGCVSYVRQRRTTHIMTKCIEINVTNIIT